MERILVAVDESGESRDALAYALEQFPDATIRAVHAPEPSAAPSGDGSTPSNRARDRAEDVLADATAMATDRDRTIETDLVNGNPAKAILRSADEQDVDGIVVGSRGREGVSRLLLGSVAETIIRRADCPVTVVR